MSWEDLQDETLESLLEFLQLKGDAESKEWAEAAFINITFRTRKNLLEKCTRMCVKSGLTETDAEEVTNRAYENLFKYCKFKPDVCKVKPVEKCFDFYLYKIARREFVDYVTPDESPYDGTESIVMSLISPSVDYTPEKLKQLQDLEARIDAALAGLSPKHKIIYLTYKAHEREGKYLPKHLRDELHTVLGLSKSTVRVYKKQAFEQVAERLYGKK